MPDQPKPDWLMVRIQTNLKEAVQAEAERRGETVSEAVRRMLRRYTQARKDVTYLRWAYCYGQLSVDKCSSLAEAVSQSVVASDAGDESFSHIEGPNGVIPKAEVDTLWRMMDAANAAEHAKQPTYTHKVHIATLEDPNQTAPLEWFHSLEDAELAASEYRKTYGDRISVRRVGT